MIDLAQQADDKEVVEPVVDNECNEDEDEYEGFHEPVTPVPPELTLIQRQCLRFCISLLDHQVHSGHYRNAMVSASATLGIDTKYMI